MSGSMTVMRMGARRARLPTASLPHRSGYLLYHRPVLSYKTLNRPRPYVAAVLEATRLTANKKDDVHRYSNLAWVCPPVFHEGNTSAAGGDPFLFTVACPSLLVLGISAAAAVSSDACTPTSKCEAPTTSPTLTLREIRESVPKEERTVVVPTGKSPPVHRHRTRFRRYLRMVARTVKLLLALTPCAALYPIYRAHRLLRGDEGKSDTEEDAMANPFDMEGKEASDWYMRMCLGCVEWSGAAVIKLMQWAGSRPDLFGHEFCNVFSQLQDSTTPHAFCHTEELIAKAYGDDWKDRIRLGRLLGSGCIGQVYKGLVMDENGNEQHVAVKVMHPKVRGDIDADLDLMRLAAYIAENLPFDVGSRIRWMNLPGVVEEFALLLKHQLDFRTEASNLERFNKNFAGDESVLFPKLIDGYETHPDVLIETFCEGVPVAVFAKEYKHDQEALTKLCTIGIRTVCKMIFDHNFIHGDLHPGNVYVSPKDHKFILLDVGMVTEYSDSDHEAIVGILTSFIRSNGRRAGELLIADSNTRMVDANEQAQNVEAYIDKIEQMTIRANGENYLMEALGSYINYIFDAAVEHHVMVNEAFVSAALAVKIQEGIALALDPNVAIWKIANPIIIESEFKRRMLKLGERVGLSEDGVRSIFNHKDKVLANLVSLEAAL